jgi:hypothetical protein
MASFRGAFHVGQVFVGAAEQAVLLLAGRAPVGPVIARARLGEMMSQGFQAGIRVGAQQVAVVEVQGSDDHGGDGHAVGEPQTPWLTRARIPGAGGRTHRKIALIVAREARHQPQTASRNNNAHGREVEADGHAHQGDEPQALPAPQPCRACARRSAPAVRIPKIPTGPRASPARETSGFAGSGRSPSLPRRAGYPHRTRRPR